MHCCCCSNANRQILGTCGVMGLPWSGIAAHSLGVMDAPAASACSSAWLLQWHPAHAAPHHLAKPHARRQMVYTCRKPSQAHRRQVQERWQPCCCSAQTTPQPYAGQARSWLTALMGSCMLFTPIGCGNSNNSVRMHATEAKHCQQIQK